MKQPVFENAFDKFKDIIISEFEKHDHILSSDRLKPVQRKKFEDIYNGTSADSVYSTSLKLLSDCLYRVYEKK